MKGMKLISVFCALAMVLSCIQIPAFAAGNVTAIDLSENKTRFTDDDETDGTIKVFTVDSEGVREKALDNALFAFDSSDTGIVAIDEDGDYSIVGDGVSVITVSLKENPSVKRSMIFYCGGTNSDYLSADNFEEYISATGFKNSYEATGGKGTQPLYTMKNDPWRGGQEVSSDPFYGKMVKPQGGTSLTSFILSAWQYDHFVSTKTKRNAPRLGISNGNESWYAYFGINPVANGAQGGSLKFVTKGISPKYLVNKEVSREQGWHHFMMIALRDTSRSEVLTEGAAPTVGITEIKWYYDGELVVHLLTASAVKPAAIQQSAGWITGREESGKNGYINIEGTGLFSERYLAALDVTSTPLEFVEMNVMDEDMIASDKTIEATFNKSLDEDRSNLTVELTEIETGESIAVDTAFSGAKFSVTPTYPLMAGREYQLTITGTAASVSSPVENSATLDFSRTITFVTEKAENYADNLIVTEAADKLSAEADYIGSGDGYLVLSQFDADGVQVSKAAGEIEEGILEDKLADTEYVEAYAWSGINALDIKPLSSAAILDAPLERVYTDNTENDGETKLSASYNADSGKIVIKVTSKTMRKGLPVIVRVVKPEKDVEDATIENFDEIYSRAEQLVTNENGVLEYEFELSDSGSGEYTVVVNLPFEETALTDSFNFVSQKDLYNSIGTLLDSNADNVEENFAAARKIIDIDYSAYDALKNKKIALMQLAGYEGACDTLEDFVSLFNKSVETVKILENNDIEALKENKDAWGIGGNSLYDKYVAFENAEERQAINDIILKKGFNNDETLKEAFMDAVTLYFIKDMKNYSQLFPFITEINDVLKLELPEETPDEAMRYLSGKISEINSIATLKEKYAEAIQEKGTGSSGGSAGGSGGSGGFGGGGGGSSSGGLKGGSGGGYTAKVDGEYEAKTEQVAGAELPKWVEEERMLAERKVFDDLQSVLWAEDSIRELYNRGIISGRGEGIFAPNDYVTREEAAKMLILMTGTDISQISGDMPFADVGLNAWYAPYVLAAQQKGIVNGKSETIFGTGEYITREELCTLADRAAISADIFLDDEFTIKPFDDEIQISQWALNSVLKMRESFIVSGMGGNVFNPKALVTRAQAAKIIYGVIAYGEQ